MLFSNSNKEIERLNQRISQLESRLDAHIGRQGVRSNDTRILVDMLPKRLVKGYYPFECFGTPLNKIYATRTPEWIHENHWVLLYDYSCDINSNFDYDCLAWEIRDPSAIRLCDIPEMYDFITYFLQKSGFNIRQHNSAPSFASKTNLTTHTRLVKGMPMLSCVNCRADYPNLYNTHWGRWHCPLCKTQYYASGNALYYWKGWW